MQCPRCGAITADDAFDTLYCSNCGARRAESAEPTAISANGDASDIPTRYIDAQPVGEQSALTTAEPQMAAGAFTLPATPSLPLDNATLAAMPPVSATPLVGAGWSEFSGASVATDTPTGTSTTYPPAGGYPAPNGYPQPGPGGYPMYPQQPVPGAYPQPAPGGYMSPNTYMQPGYPYPYTPIQTAPKRKSPVLAIILSVLVVLLIAGGVFAGIFIGQAHSKTGTTQPTVATSPTATPTPDPDQLYQQITSLSPSFTDSLQDPTSSQWSVYEKPTYGCEVKSDGLHVHVQDTDRFSYCSSEAGRLSNFAFQVDMKILTGQGGGIVFREASTGNFYVFYVFKDGVYRLEPYQNDKSGISLGYGAIHTTAYNAAQTNTLTVIAQGSQLSIYLNKTLLTQAQDSTYTNGYVGVLADDYDSPAEVLYTNAKIWVL